LREVEDKSGARTAYTYDAAGRITCMTNALGYTIRLAYNAAGWITQESNQLGSIRRYTYTSMGKIDSVTDETGRVTRYEYEPGGRLSSVHHPDGTKDTVSYDNAGNIKCVTDRAGHATEYEYDRLNRITEITGARDSVISYGYDAVGNVTRIADENGRATSYGYTLTGQLAKVTDANGNATLYAYDACDRLIETRHMPAPEPGQGATPQCATGHSAVNSQQRVTLYKRNKMGQVETVTDALGNAEHYRYDVCGRVIEKLDRDGYLTKYSYTACGDVSSILYADGREVKLTYNRLRQLIRVDDWLGTTCIEADGLGRASRVTDHRGKTVSYVYNEAGQRTGISYPCGKNIAYSYDNLLRLIEVTDGNSSVHYRYDELSRLTAKVFSDGTKTEYRYDTFGRLGTLCHSDPGGILDRYVYTYDNAGRKTGIQVERTGLPEENGTYEYRHDTLNRLREVLKDGETLRTYAYDAYGNRIEMTDGGRLTSYAYNAGNQLISTAYADGTVHDFTYDKRGNLTEVCKDGETIVEYRFGSLNRLEEAVNRETGLGAKYLHNGLGHRVAQSIGDPGMSPIKRIDDVLDLTRHFNNLLERSEDGSDASYVWDSSLLFSAKDSHQAVPFLLDDIGSPIRFGSETYSYDEFGNALHAPTQAGQPFGFAGYQRDAEAGVWFAQLREYDSSSGRFISEDLIKGIARLPHTMNPYPYCWNHPLDFADPNAAWPIRLSSIAEWLKDVTEPATAWIDDNVVQPVTTAISDYVVEPVTTWVDDNIVQPIATGVTDYIIQPATSLYNTTVGFATDVWSDLSNFDLDNRSETAVFDANYFSAYRGQLVLRLPISGRSASVGPVMLLMKDVNRNDRGINTIRHEWGHSSGQFAQLNPLRFFPGIGAPSARAGGYLFGDPYYAQPWEIIADLYGGVDRSHSLDDIELGLQYMEHLHAVNGFDDMLGLLSTVFGVAKPRGFAFNSWIDFGISFFRNQPIFPGSLQK